MSPTITFRVYVLTSHAIHGEYMFAMHEHMHEHFPSLFLVGAFEER